MRRKLKNIEVKVASHLKEILNEPISKITFLEPRGMIDKVHNSEKNITIHLYNEAQKRNNKTILNSFPGVSQIYFSIDEETIFSTIVNQSSSGRRFDHNLLIDKITDSKEIMEKIPTMIMKFVKNFPIAYFLYEKYAYLNQGIDENYHKGLMKKLGNLKIPYSSYEGGILNQNSKIIFYDYVKEVEIYKTLNKDILSVLLD